MRCAVPHGVYREGETPAGVSFVQIEIEETMRCAVGEVAALAKNPILGGGAIDMDLSGLNHGAARNPGTVAAKKVETLAKDAAILVEALFSPEWQDIFTNPSLVFVKRIDPVGGERRRALRR